MGEDEASAQGAGLGDQQRSPPTSTILWFYRLLSKSRKTPCGDTLSRGFIFCPVTVLPPCLHTGEYHACSPRAREGVAPAAWSQPGQQDGLKRSRPGASWALQGCSSQVAGFSFSRFSRGKAVILRTAAWGWSLPRDRWAVLSRKALACAPSSPWAAPVSQIFSCASEHLFLIEVLEWRGISDQKLQTPLLSWQPHHIICFLTFSQPPS